MLTLARLMSNTPNAVRRRAAGQCRMDKVRRRKTTRYTEMHFGASCTDGIRVVTFRFYGAVAKQTPVWVSCTCPAWLYFCEVAVAGSGSTDVLYSNGAPPEIRNPDKVPYLCKHLFAVAAIGIEETRIPNLLQKVFPKRGPSIPMDDPAELRRRYVEKAKQKERDLIDQSKKLDMSKPSLVHIPDRLKERLLGIQPENTADDGEGTGGGVRRRR